VRIDVKEEASAKLGQGMTMQRTVVRAPVRLDTSLQDGSIQKREIGRDVRNWVKKSCSELSLSVAGSSMGNRTFIFRQACKRLKC